MELIGAFSFIKVVPRFSIPYNEFYNINKLEEYIVLKDKEIRQMMNDLTKKPSSTDKLVQGY